MRRLPWIALATTLVLAGGVLTACGTATGLPRFYTTKPKTAMTKSERYLNHSSSGNLSDAQCRLYDGDRARGWRHEICVGNYKYHTGIYFRFREVITPRSCAEIQETFTVRVPKTFTIPGLGRKKWYRYTWDHRSKGELFTCKH